MERAMPQPAFLRNRLTWITLAAATLALTLPAAAAETTGTGQDIQPGQLPELAERGQFIELLTRLKDDYPGRDDATVQSLIHDLERYRDHRDKDREQRRQAHEDALDEVRKALDDDRVEDALVSAIEAHGLADNPDATLERAIVKQLVERADQAGINAKKNSNWVKALNLYRLLDLLYDDYGHYREQVKLASKHVRVLRIYAPQVLRDLYEQRRKEREARREKNNNDDADTDPNDANADDPSDDDSFEAPVIDDDSWQTQLKGVSRTMLREALHHAARKHIRQPGYLPLMQGAVDALLVLVRTESLADTFPAFHDKAKVDRFTDFLERTAAKLDAKAKNPQNNQDQREMGFIEANSMINEIRVMNDNTLDLPERVLIYEMGEGATATLDDFSGVIWPRQMHTIRRSMQGKFSGVGIKITRENGQLTVESPLPGTPAFRAGIQADDIIAEVDGADTSTWSLDKAVRQITGPKGTVVTLGIERRGEEELIDYDIRRAEIEIASVLGWRRQGDDKWDYMIDPDSRIGYVRISQFLPQTADDLDAAVQKMQDAGDVKGLIVDLRFNPGGLLDAAVAVADRFVKEGPIVFNVDGDGQRVNDGRQPRHAEAQRTYKHFPVVVLINQGSASASEIVSGALQDYGRAVVLGTRSFGKGSVQDVVALAQGEALLKLTTQHYMLPEGRIIHRRPNDETWGIAPDLKIEMTDEQAADAIEFRRQVDVLRNGDAGDDDPQATQILSEGKDPQLEAALLVLKTRLAARHIAMAQMPQKRAASKR